MTERKHSRAANGCRPVAIPSRCQLKASYQRHMLYGMLGAMLLVAVPTVILAYWPTSVPPDDPPPVDPPDTIVVDLREIVVDQEEPEFDPGPPGGDPSEGDITINPFVRPELVSDDADIVEDELGGMTGAAGGIGPDTSGIWQPFPGDGGPVVFVPDTAVYQMAAVDKAPALIAMETPEYPPMARRQGVEGTVILHVLVGTDGKPLEVLVHAESPEGFGFGEYAMRTARTATFGPAIHRSQSVRCWVSFPVVFELEDCR